MVFHLKMGGMIASHRNLKEAWNLGTQVSPCRELTIHGLGAWLTRLTIGPCQPPLTTPKSVLLFLDYNPTTLRLPISPPPRFGLLQPAPRGSIEMSLSWCAVRAWRAWR